MDFTSHLLQWSCVRKEFLYNLYEREEKLQQTVTLQMYIWPCEYCFKTHLNVCNVMCISVSSVVKNAKPSTLLLATERKRQKYCISWALVNFQTTQMGSKVQLKLSLNTSYNQVRPSTKIKNKYFTIHMHSV